MIPSYGGLLKDSSLTSMEWESLVHRKRVVKIQVSPEEKITLFNMSTGAYSPVDRPMNKHSFERVMRQNQLDSGAHWTIPLSFPLSLDELKEMEGAQYALLYDQKDPYFLIQIEDLFQIDLHEFCQCVYRTTDPAHPGVKKTLQQTPFRLGGRLWRLKNQVAPYYKTPEEFRAMLKEFGASEHSVITAFSTRNIGHVGHEYLQRLALEQSDYLTINVITGAEVEGSFRSEVVFDYYKRFINQYYDPKKVFLNNLRLPPIYAGPKEAFLQAIVMQNYGNTHFIVGRDHAGRGGFYGKYASQEIFKELNTLEIKIRPYQEPRFCLICRQVTTVNSCPHHQEEGKTVALDGTKIRSHIQNKESGSLAPLLKPECEDLLRTWVQERELFT